jgi:DNA topoisomerase-3
MPGKILCVAEKPSISKAVAGHLSGGQLTTVSGSSKEKMSIVSN